MKHKFLGTLFWSICALSLFADDAAQKTPEKRPPLTAEEKKAVVRTEKSVAHSIEDQRLFETIAAETKRKPEIPANFGVATMPPWVIGNVSIPGDQTVSYTVVAYAEDYVMRISRDTFDRKQMRWTSVLLGWFKSPDLWRSLKAAALKRVQTEAREKEFDEQDLFDMLK
jgi:hypothetical protein